MSTGTIEAIKQFVIGVVVPPVAGFLATWLASTPVLAVFHITANTAVTEITQVLVFGVTTILAGFVGHAINKGTFSPAAKAARGRLGQ